MPSPRAAKYLPDDWETVSARGLFAILKPRDLNPVDYDKKIEFWSNLIAKYCHVSKTAMADFNILRQKFRRGNLLPSPLDGVMQEMHRNGTLQTMEEFQRKQGWLSWGMSLISGPSQIDFTKIIVAHIPTVKILAKDIKQFQQELADEYDDYPEVIAFDELKERCRHIVADDFSFEFVIQQLIKWGDVSEGISKSGDRVLKFSEKNDSNARFTETDASIHDIRRAMTKIENEIKRLENKEKELKEEAKKTLHNRNKTGALKILRRKKTVEKEIEMKDNQYRQLLEMLQQIASTRQTKEVLDAYKAGNKAFKDALGRQGLTVENIDQTIDSIHDVFQAAKDVEDAVSTGLRSNTQIIDDDEVEAELEEMIEADKVAEQNNRVKVNKNIINIGNLPEVPTNNISIDDSLEQRMRRLRETA